jgi:hypothetical protein
MSALTREIETWTKEIATSTGEIASRRISIATLSQEIGNYSVERAFEAPRWALIKFRQPRRRLPRRVVNREEAKKRRREKPGAPGRNPDENRAAFQRTNAASSRVIRPARLLAD